MKPNKTISADDAAAIVDMLALAAASIRETASTHARVFRGKSAVSASFERALIEVDRLSAILSA